MVGLYGSLRQFGLGLWVVFPVSGVPLGSVMSEFFLGSREGTLFKHLLQTR